MPLKPGDQAPAISLLDQKGDKVQLKDFRGRKVLVFFYPETLT
jgi:peroxiredoxin Q/BCP